MPVGTQGSHTPAACSFPGENARSITASICSLLEPEPAQPMQKRRRAEAQAGLKLARAPVKRSHRNEEKPVYHS